MKTDPAERGRGDLMVYVCIVREQERHNSAMATSYGQMQCCEPTPCFRSSVSSGTPIDGAQNERLHCRSVALARCVMKW